jgi:hypothetical protein
VQDRRGIYLHCSAHAYGLLFLMLRNTFDWGLNVVVTTEIRQLALILNTVVLITALIIVELVYAEQPRRNRTHLRMFYPLFLVLGGLLIYAAYVQGKG